MMKYLIILFVFSASMAKAVDDPKTFIRILNKKFSLVKDYTADVKMVFDIPGVRMNRMNGKVFFKQPDKFRIKAKGIFFLPKKNPMQDISAMLLDTSSYTAVISGYETVQMKECAIINIIPLNANTELILGKFWIDTKNPLVLKSQITTKKNGTVETENFYGANAVYGLAEKIIIKVEVKKIKMSKMMAADINKKAKDKSNPDQLETGSIILQFSDYKINSNFSNKELTDVE